MFLWNTLRFANNVVILWNSNDSIGRTIEPIFKLHYSPLTQKRITLVSPLVSCYWINDQHRELTITVNYCESRRIWSVCFQRIADKTKPIPEIFVLRCKQTYLNLSHYSHSYLITLRQLGLVLLCISLSHETLAVTLIFVSFFIFSFVDCRQL